MPASNLADRLIINPRNKDERGRIIVTRGGEVIGYLTAQRSGMSGNTSYYYRPVDVAGYAGPRSFQGLAEARDLLA